VLIWHSRRGTRSHTDAVTETPPVSLRLFFGSLRTPQSAAPDSARLDGCSSHQRVCVFLVEGSTLQDGLTRSHTETWMFYNILRNQVTGYITSARGYILCNLAVRVNPRLHFFCNRLPNRLQVM